MTQLLQEVRGEKGKEEKRKVQKKIKEKFKRRKNSCSKGF